MRVKCEKKEPVVEYVKGAVEAALCRGELHRRAFSQSHNPLLRQENICSCMNVNSERDKLR